MIKFSIWDKLLIGLLSLHLTANFFWIIFNNAPFPWDQATHATISLQIAKDITTGQLFNIISASNYYPILVHFIASLPIIVFGPLPKLIQLTATVLFLLTIFMVYRYLVLITGSKKISFISSALFSFFPVVFNYSKWLMLDIPAVGVLFLSLYLLEKSRNLLDQKYSIFFFIAMGLLMMTKWTGLLFLIIPALFTLTEVIRKGEYRKVLGNIFLGFVCFLLIVLPWYSINFKSLLFQSGINVIGEEGAKPANVLSLQSITLYFYYLFNSQTNFLVAISFFLSLPVFIYLKIKKKWFILLMIAGNYAIFTLIGNKDSRYTMAYLPFIALVIIYAFESLKNATLRNLLLVLVVLVSFLYYSLLTIRPDALEGLYWSIKIPVIGRADIINLNDRLVTKYDLQNWSLDLVLQDLEKFANGKDITAQIAIEDMHLNPSTLNFYLYVKKYNGLLTNIKFETPDVYFLRANYNQDTFPGREQIKSYLNNTNYILISPTDVGTQFLRNKEALIQLRYYVLNNSLLSCNAFQVSIAPANTTCFVKTGEVLQTNSDVQIEDRAVQKGEKIVSGFSKVYCQWGCTFLSIHPADNFPYPAPSVVNSYFLPDSKLVHLYRI